MSILEKNCKEVVIARKEKQTNKKLLLKLRDNTIYLNTMLLASRPDSKWALEVCCLLFLCSSEVEVLIFTGFQLCHALLDFKLTRRK